MAQNGNFKKFLGANKRFFALVIVIFTLFMMSSTLTLIFLTRPAGRVSVPNVINEKFTSVYGSLKKKDLNPELVFYDTADMIDGIVIGQYPEPNKVVARGTRVKLTVTRNNLRVKVPDLTGMQLAIARNNLSTLTVGSQHAALEPGVITYMPSNDAPENTIIEQSPKAEQFVTKDTPINLLVSSGKIQSEKTVPQVAGQYIDLASGLLASRGISVTHNIIEADAENGMIIDQSLSAGSPAGPMQISIAYREPEKRYYKAYDRASFQTPKDKDERTLPYEVWVSDDSGKRLCLSRDCASGEKVDFVFYRKGNAAIEIVSGGKKIKTIHVKAFKF